MGDINSLNIETLEKLFAASGGPGHRHAHEA